MQKASKEQEVIFETILTEDCNILVDAKAGTGKCLGKDTGIIMYDGSIKKVQDVIEGDLLMGDDSNPRKVLSTTKGNGKLYLVSPNKEKSFICNDVHVLTLKFSASKMLKYTTDIPLNKLLTTANYNYRRNGVFVNYSLYKELVDFKNEYDFDYYSLGRNFFNQELKRKHILTTIENRYMILSGIVDRYCTIQDTDLKIKNSSVEINQYLFKELMDSLGCSLSYYGKGNDSYYIRGDFERLTLKDKTKNNELNRYSKRNYNQFRFSVDFIGDGDYYGFTLDGNGRFLLDNYIVTHNTTTIKGSVERIRESNPEAKIALVAFNKHISTELKERIETDDNLRISTTHGIGYGAIKRRFEKKNKTTDNNKKVIIDNNKVLKIINKKISSWSINSIGTDLHVYKSNMENIVGLCKLTLSQTAKQVEYTANKYGYKVTPELVSRIRQVLDHSIRDTKTFDFNDMVFLPAIDNKYFIFPSDYVFVDECIAGDQMVLTENGGIKMKDLFNKKKKNTYIKLPMVMSYTESEKDFDYNRITKIWRNKVKKKIVKVKTYFGNYYTSDNHPYLTVNGWKMAMDLTSDDLLISYFEGHVGRYLPNDDQRKFLQACVMTRYRKSNVPNQQNLVYENNLSLNTIKNYDYYDLFETYSYKNIKAEMYRVHTAKIHFPEYNPNKLDFLNNMDARDLAVIYMEHNVKNNTKSKFAIHAETFDHLIIYKKIIEEKFNLTNLKVRRIKHKKYQLTVQESQVDYFWNLIKEYVFVEFLNGEIIKQRYDWKIKDDMIPVTSIHSVSTKLREEFTYDMTVENNHNFILVNSNEYTAGVVVHNCQDYNKAQQHILKKMLKKDTGRLIAFGDRNQAIYAFMGADIDSFNWFRDMDNTRTLPLSTSYRCSKKVIELAQTLVPDIKAKHDADEGDIRFGSVLDEADSGDFVLSRKNAPFIKLVFDLMDRGKVATIRGKDIGETIKEKIKNYRTFAELDAMINETLNSTILSLAGLGITEPHNTPQYLIVKDNMDIIRNLMLRTRTISEIMSKIDSIFTDNPQGIILSTIHKSKGLEADRVFIIRPNEMKIKSPLAWMWQGELNLEYIAYTRAKKEIIMDQDWTDGIN